MEAATDGPVVVRDFDLLGARPCDIFPDLAGLPAS